jgi:hypothetical protein
MRTVLVAAIALLAASASFAQPVAESQKETLSPCQPLLSRFGSQKAWWKASTRWAELKPAPAVAELDWLLPLYVTPAVHGDAYYLVAHNNAQRCYVVVCGGTGNVCRFFQAPSSNAGPNP